ncbi:MAG: hypothetical protein IKP50_05545, partial [Bacilli bacterium]|nr:hypothetical protein [Bacilli bacterium]
YLADSNLNKDILNYLSRLQIFDSLEHPELEDCCFIYAVKQTGKFTEEQLNLMRMRVKSRYLTAQNIIDIANEFHFKVIVHRIDPEAKGRHKNDKVKEKKRIGYKDATSEFTFDFDLFEHHYFIHERTPFSSDFIKHLDIAPVDATCKRYHKKGSNIKWEKFNPENEPSRIMTSDDLVLNLMKQNKFIPITYATASLLKTTLYENIENTDFPLDIVDEKAVLRLITPKPTKMESKKKSKKKPEKEITYWYADFEADVKKGTEMNHEPFMCVVQSADGSKNKCFKGPNCAKEFLNFLPDNSVCYFHNLAYDWCMFNRHASCILKVIKKGSKIYQAKIVFNKKRLIFKDSYPVFTCKLADLPEAFNLDGIKKELFPYKYYTLERLKTNIGVIDGAGKDEDKPWTEEDYETFNANIDAIEGCRIDEGHFNMYEYAKFYCEQDVRILREAFEKLCEGFKKEFDIDAKTMITTPAIANEYFRQKAFIPNGNVYEVGGHVREFMSRAIYGGRCMCAYNKKWHSTKPIDDYDAVSLYPSAMNRLWVVEGKPEVLKVPDTNVVWTKMPDYLEEFRTDGGIGAFVIEIKIVKVHKHYAFPLIVQHTESGNLNDDTNISAEHPVIMVIDNIGLEDLIEFQHIDFQVIKGYIWKGKRDYRIQDVIKKVFDTRAKYKKAGNPLEQLYKLVMNSAYGKTIQKPVDFDIKFLSKWKKSPKDMSRYERYWQKNYYKIIEVLYETDEEAMLKVKSPVDKHFNCSLFGIQVLSMSKRIMNEVMCLAFDLKCHIYYQDTDSMHIESDDLPRLEKAFERKYNRKLRGEGIMGCFHSDFPKINGHKKLTPRAIESYFIAKKLYVDHIQDSTGDTDFMIRGKGLTQQSIRHAAESYGGIMKLYKKLFKTKKGINFDLTVGQPSFDMKKDFTVASRNAFIREVKGTYDIAERKNYFKMSSKHKNYHKTAFKYKNYFNMTLKRKNNFKIAAKRKFSLKMAAKIVAHIPNESL